MQIIGLRHPQEPYTLRECGLVLGNFDGVHRGHRALIDELKRLNAKRSPRLPLGALCFSEHPSYTLGEGVPRLCSNEEKMEIFRRAGLQFVIFCSFPDLMHLSPEAFVRDILVNICHCRMAVCGYNYTFGAKGAGKAEDLARLLQESGADASIVAPVTDGRHVISSTVIRDMLERGHPEDAARLLGRPYTLTGKVARGKHVGRVMGFPTANLTFDAKQVIPAHGVYAVTVKIGRRSYFGISNIGTRPTFQDGDHVTCETFLFEFNGDLYGKTLQVCFLHFLREERPFANQSALQAQIERDIATAREYLNF